ncbi:MFS general substrate transporter, partial [Mycena rebaudengoi]
VFQDFYTRQFLSNETPSTISWIGSVQLALQYIIGVISGKLFDNGHFHTVMLPGTVLFLLSSFMLSLAKPHHFYQVLLSQGFGMGIGSGLVFLPSLGIASHYFRQRRAVAMGIMISMIFSILLNKMIAREDLGFPWAMRFVAFINVFLLAVANLTMKPRPPTIKPEAVDMRQIYQDGPYWVTIFGLFLGFWGIFVPYFYLQLFSFKQGVDVGGAFLADRYGPLNGATVLPLPLDLTFPVIIPCGVISGTIMWALLGVHSIAGVTVFALLYGFVLGAFLSLSSPSIAAFSTSPTLNDIGLRIGISCLAVGLALLSGNPIAGALLSPPQYLWWRPLTFGCVRVFCFHSVRQVTVVTGYACIWLHIYSVCTPGVG